MLKLRFALDQYINLRPVKLYNADFCPIKDKKPEDIDFVVIRENSEGLYKGMGKFLNKGKRTEVATQISYNTRKGVERCIRYAFEYAVKNGHKKVSLVHKANIMKFTDGLFLRTGQKIAQEYAGRIAFEDVIVDNMCMQLVQKPELYDVLVLPNLYGDIVSDLCAGLVGGLGIAPGANIGKDAALFEPVHGSAPKYAGQNKVNPTATILSGIMMLRHIGEADAAARLEKALFEVIKEGKSVTYDLKADRNDPSAVGTQEMAEAICKKLRG